MAGTLPELLESSLHRSICPNNQLIGSTGQGGEVGCNLLGLQLSQGSGTGRFLLQKNGSPHPANELIGRTGLESHTGLPDSSPLGRLSESQCSLSFPLPWREGRTKSKQLWDIGCLPRLREAYSHSSLIRRREIFLIGI